jgi:hypothetical protein
MKLNFVRGSSSTNQTEETSEKKEKKIGEEIKCRLELNNSLSCSEMRRAARLQRRLSSVTATMTSSSSSLGGGDVHPQSSLFLLKRYLSAAAAVPEQKLSMDDKNFLDGSYVRRSSLLFLVVVYSPLLLCLLF